MNLSAKTRTWIYSILLTVQPLAVAYGLVNNTTAGLWVNMVAALLGTGLALTNVTPDAAPGKHEATPTV